MLSFGKDISQSHFVEHVQFAARLLVIGRGVKQDVIEGMKWHLLARAAGVGDAWLDSQLNLLTQWQRDAVDAAVKQYVGS